MAFQKGQSGNPKGRAKNSGKIGAWRKQLEGHAEELLNALVDRALNGDVQALKFCVEQILPKHKATLPPVEIPIQDGDLAGIGQTILNQTSKGELAADVASAIMAMLQAQAKLIETDELVKRVEALENKP